MIFFTPLAVKLEGKIELYLHLFVIKYLISLLNALQAVQVSSWGGSIVSVTAKKSICVIIRAQSKQERHYIVPVLHISKHRAACSITVRNNVASWMAA